MLSAFDTIKVCVAYDCDGVRYTTVPEHESVFVAAKPVYEELPGWRGVDISGCRSFDELPETAQSYVRRVEELAHAKVSFVSVGPDRDQTINCGWE